MVAPISPKRRSPGEGFLGVIRFHGRMKTLERFRGKPKRLRRIAWLRDLANREY